MNLIGVDIIEIARIEQAINRWSSVFLHRVYSKAELVLCRGKAPSLAARFAGKEAVIKVLSRDGRGIFLRDVEVLSEPGGKPVIRLSNRAQTMAKRLGITGVSISLSHSKDYAVAFAIGNS